MSFLGTALKLTLAYEGSVAVLETVERHNYYRYAREYCDQVGKPLLRIGLKRSPFEPPNGDVTLDISSEVLSIPGGVLGDERKMPFSTGQFGCCFNEHTLEHLHEPSDVALAVSECIRVADMAIFLCPSPYSLYANFLNPTHYLRLWFDPEKNTIYVGKNQYRTGLGFMFPSDEKGDAGIRQSLIARGKTPTVFYEK